MSQLNFVLFLISLFRPQFFQILLQFILHLSFKPWGVEPLFKKFERESHETLLQRPPLAAQNRSFAHLSFLTELNTKTRQAMPYHMDHPTQ